MKLRLIMVAMIAATAVAVTVPASASAVVRGCPRNVVCLYEHAGWNLEWRTWYGYRTDRIELGGRYPPGPNQNDFPGQPWFYDVTSSWSNNTIYRWCVYNDVFGTDQRLWTMDPTTWKSTVDSGDNDKADYAKRC